MDTAYISPFLEVGLGRRRPEYSSRCHLPPPQGSITSAATTSTRISANVRCSGVVLEAVRLVVPQERRIEQEGQEQVVAVIDDLQLADRAFLGGVEDHLLLRTVGRGCTA